MLFVAEQAKTMKQYGILILPLFTLNIYIAFLLHTTIFYTKNSRSFVSKLMMMRWSERTSKVKCTSWGRGRECSISYMQLMSSLVCDRASCRAQFLCMLWDLSTNRTCTSSIEFRSWRTYTST